MTQPRNDNSPSPDAGRRGADHEPITVPVAVYEELKTLAAERDEYLKKLQRAVADYQNLQKRVEKMRQAANSEATRLVALKTVSLADSLARALEAAEGTEGAENLVEGLRLVEREFYAILESLDIRPIEAVGKPFDPHYHDAILQEPAEGVEANTVVRELKKGFIMGREVIRPTQVSVAAGQ